MQKAFQTFSTLFSYAEKIIMKNILSDVLFIYFYGPFT